MELEQRSVLSWKKKGSSGQIAFGFTRFKGIQIQMSSGHDSMYVKVIGCNSTIIYCYDLKHVLRLNVYPFFCICNSILTPPSWKQHYLKIIFNQYKEIQVLTRRNKTGFFKYRNSQRQTFSHPLLAPAVCGEVIHWHFDAFSLLQLSEDGDQQLEVEGIGVIEVVLILSSKLLLLFIQHLRHNQPECHNKPADSVELQGLSSTLDLHGLIIKRANTNQIQTYRILCESNTISCKIILQCDRYAQIYGSSGAPAWSNQKNTLVVPFIIGLFHISAAITHTITKHRNLAVMVFLLCVRLS